MLGNSLTNKDESGETLKIKGNTALRQGNLAEAEAFYRSAISADPSYMPAHYNLGNVLRDRGLYDEALNAYETAVKLRPDDYEVYINLGVTLTAMTRFDEAINAFNKAATLAPNAIEAAINKGVAFDRSGRYEESINAWSKVLERDPTCSMARYYRSMTYLRLGRWEEGFLDHESRLDLLDTPPEDLFPGKQEWDGEPLGGKTLLIYPEEGMGDLIQFLRYAPLCKAAGARVMVSCPPQLAPLLATSKDIDVVAPLDKPLPEPFETYISVMSLAYVLGRHPELPPLLIDVPVIPLPLIAQANGLRIGVCWQENIIQSHDSERFIPETDFWKFLANIPGVTFFSLQTGDDDPVPYTTPLAQFIHNFSDTANLVQQLDLVITVDTSLAHLCGTLGVPTWILVFFSPHWTWGVSGESTSWYPSARIFRQPSPGNWNAPLADIRKSIESKLK